MNIKISVIIVNWNSGIFLRNNITSLKKCNSLSGLEIIVVDNASGDNSLENLTKEHPEIKLFSLHQNRGFAGGANYGASKATGEWLLFLNPDIVHTKDNIKNLIAVLERKAEFDGGCGLLVDEDGKPQKGFQLKKLPTSWQCILELMVPWTLQRLIPFSRRRYYMDKDWSAPFPVEQPAAACLALKREIFKKIGGFDEIFKPAWFEDVDLGLRIMKEGGKLLFVPESVFIHEGGYSVKKLSEKEFLSLYWSNALRYYCKNFNPLFPLFRCVFVMGMIARGIVTGIVTAKGRAYLALIPLGWRIKCLGS